MIKALNTAATGMKAQQDNMDTISNNLANVNTTGFKKSRAEFEDLLYQTQREPGQAAGLNSISPTGVQTGLGVRTSAVQKSFEVGSAVQTRNPLDLMIEGAGFFQVLTPDGQIAYTRDGQFRKNAQGQVVDKNGNQLQPGVTIPPEASGIEVSASGEFKVQINGTPQTLAQLDIVNFVNPTGLKSLGRNLYASTPASGQPIVLRPGLQGAGFLSQGAVESSNVNIADELVEMIRAQRSFETNSKAIQAADQMLQSVNNLR